MALVELVERVAEANDGRVVGRDRGSVRVDVRPTLDSGAPAPTYSIEVSTGGGTLRAREHGTSLLPTYCPERHINADGSFCLYWAEEEPLGFATEDDVMLWWGKLLAFLRRQIAVDSLRRWPGKGRRPCPWAGSGTPPSDGGAIGSRLGRAVPVRPQRGPPFRSALAQPAAPEGQA